MVGVYRTRNPGEPLGTRCSLPRRVSSRMGTAWKPGTDEGLALGSRDLGVHRDLVGIERIVIRRGDVGREFDRGEGLHAVPVQGRAPIASGRASTSFMSSSPVCPWARAAASSFWAELASKVSWARAREGSNADERDDERPGLPFPGELHGGDPRPARMSGLRPGRDPAGGYLPSR